MLVMFENKKNICWLLDGADGVAIVEVIDAHATSAWTEVQAVGAGRVRGVGRC